MKAVKISLLYLLAHLTSLEHVTATRLSGSISYSDLNRNKLVFFLSRFGVEGGHEIYVFGTAVREKGHQIGLNSRMTLAFIPQATWDSFYSLAKDPNSVGNCQHVMNATLGSSIIVDENSCVSGFNDYLRKIPCNPTDGDYIYCNQPASVNATAGSDFTYHERNAPNTEFYYVFIIACTRNATETCQWGDSDAVYFKYDITIVNSDPSGPKDIFDYHFSFEFHGVLILEMVFTILYLVLVIIHLTLHSRLIAGKGYSPHRLINLFTVSLVLELLHVGCQMIHFAVYAADGKGVIAMKYFGEVFNELSDWLLILVLILIAKGWQVTTCTVRWKKLTSIAWGVYILISAIFFVWMVVKEQVYPLNTILELSFQSWAGAIYLVYRVFVLVYSLYGMRQMYLIENRETKLKLYIVLSIVYLIWFLYLPFVVVLLFAVNPVLRYVTLRTIMLVFDLFINTFILALFCPKWSDKFFQFESHINMLSKTSWTYKLIGGTYGSAPQII